LTGYAEMAAKVQKTLFLILLRRMGRFFLQEYQNPLRGLGIFTFFGNKRIPGFVAMVSA
jgi:hypothetical protein